MKILKKIFGKSDVKIDANEIAVASNLLLGGAVIVEEGYNSNGKWIKFGNGLLICTHEMTIQAASTAYGSVFRSPTQTWTFPHVFSNRAATSFNVTTGTDFFWAGNGTGGQSLTHTSWSIFRPVAFTNMSFTVTLLAIGRWK